MLVNTLKVVFLVQLCWLACYPSFKQPYTGQNAHTLIAPFYNTTVYFKTTWKILFNKIGANVFAQPQIGTRIYWPMFCVNRTY